MPKGQEVTPLASPNSGEKQVPSDQGDNEILEDNLEEDVHNISFDESQHKVVQSCRVLTLMSMYLLCNLKNEWSCQMCADIQLHWLMLQRNVPKPPTQV